MLHEFNYMKRPEQVAKLIKKKGKLLVFNPERQVRGRNVVPLLMGTELSQRSKCSKTDCCTKRTLNFNGLIIRYINYIKKQRHSTAKRGRQNRNPETRRKKSNLKKVLLEIIYKMHKSHAYNNTLQQDSPNKSDIPTSLMKF